MERETMPERTVTVARFGSLSEAMVSKTVLESAGIDCYLVTDDMVRPFDPWETAVGGARLQVLESDAVDARALLDAPGDLPPADL